MSEKTDTLIGYCGLYCGACPHYRASLPEGAHLLAEAAREGREIAGYACRGCRSDNLYIHPGCAACRIRGCAQAKGLPHCGLCAEMPCDELLAFRDDGHAHHLDIQRNLAELSRIGPGAWLAAQEERWQCGCGMAYSWYENSCRRCGRALAAYRR